MFNPGERKILFIEACNYVDFPVGGQLSLAKQMASVFGDELYLVGVVTDETPVGEWVKKEINGVLYNYFALHKIKRTANKPLIPRRISTLYYLKKYRKSIVEYNFEYSICCAPEVLIAVSNWNLTNLTYIFSGTENPLRFSKRWYGRMLTRLYDPIFYPCLKKAKYLLAAADMDNITRVIQNNRKVLSQRNIIQFPTRVNTDLFKAGDNKTIREELHIPIDAFIITTTGRLHWAKGWKLMIEAFKEFLRVVPNSYLYFLGDGDSRSDIENFAYLENISDRVILSGFQSQEIVAKYLQSSNLYIMGSLQEGWSTSLLEAKGCCVPICTTKFSSASDIVRHGVDGYVVQKRDPLEFSKCMVSASLLKIDPLIQNEEMKKYSVTELKHDFFKIWNLTN